MTDSFSFRQILHTLLAAVSMDVVTMRQCPLDIVGVVPFAVFNGYFVVRATIHCVTGGRALMVGAQALLKLYERSTIWC